MNRARVVLRFPLSEHDLGEALRLHREADAPVVVKPRAYTILPPAMPLTLIKAIPPHPVREIGVAPSLPTVRPPRRVR